MKAMKPEDVVVTTSTHSSTHEKLSKIQQEFKAKKSRFNKFGNYNYRSAEDILEALKPLMKKYSVNFTTKEELLVPDPPMIKTTAQMVDYEANQMIESSAVVGVDLNSKGMSMQQKFGAASSYAKKYAYGNLLMIDDTADDDATNKHNSAPPKQEWSADFDL